MNWSEQQMNYSYMKLVLLSTLFWGLCTNPVKISWKWGLKRARWCSWTYQLVKNWKFTSWASFQSSRRKSQAMDNMAIINASTPILTGLRINSCASFSSKGTNSFFQIASKGSSRVRQWRSPEIDSRSPFSILRKRPARPSIPSFSPVI